MFGTNPVRKQELREDGQLVVHSIFPTIQGEGPYAGEPAIFVRLWGCNLRCYFCDTDFETRSTLITGDRMMDQIQRLVATKCNTKLIVLTGGEPFRQNIVPFIMIAAVNGMHVQIETAGTLWLREIEPYIQRGNVTIVCSPKTGKVHEMISHYCSNWKYLIKSGEVNQIDGLPDFSTQEEGKRQPLYRPERSTDTVWLQPCEEYNVAKGHINLIGSKVDQVITGSVRDDVRSSKNVDLCVRLVMMHGFRISLQLHKILGLE